ncbi:DUF705 domain-containing protein [Deinococcus pimensis]|uniref:DUF705 domain-containing protein n=1 Tax=Deinococcus pimensis TaxID=309888 RepID=UPI0004881BD8|nr:DUF705 domain-containing protein [Deinococcus pimensis]
MTRTPAPLVVYVDVDETLIRNYGKSRIPIPTVIKQVRRLFEQGAELYCWSSGGAQYARQSAVECGLEECFVAFLPKPQVLIDDQHMTAWRRMTHVHPMECDSQDVSHYRDTLGRPR